MSRILLHCLLLTAWFVHIDSEAYQDRPKIKTLDGDLILEPGYDKNIYIRPNGPKSTVFVGQVNILKENVMIHEQTQPSVSDDVDKAGILQRLAKLESQSTDHVNDVYNITALWTKVNSLQRRVNSLQNRLSLLSVDDCLSQPCVHGGTCLSLMDGFHCLCPSNWEGKRCDVDVNECRNFAGTDLGCQNGATCINKPGTYECLCRNNWFGLHCTRKAKDCYGGDFEMCGFGTCIQTSTGEGIKCLCNQGWTTNGTGVACLTDVNECDSQLGPRCSVNPKVTCINLPGSFRCGNCPLGYEGDGFSCNDIDECITQNGGCSPLVACHNTIGSRICGSCPPGYLGDGTTCTWRGSCNINRGGCHPSAQCLDNGLATQCICPEGMNGDGVGIHGCYVLTGGNYTQRCENNPCGSHGQCHMLQQGYTCICYRGFSGAHCDTPTDYCSSNPCRNGGSCRPDSSLTRGFRCECTAQYSGPLCQVFSKRCGSVLNNEEGSIVYPLSNSSYNHNSSCAWVIHTVSDKVINVTFSKFDLEQSTGCLFDFLQIHDGRSSASQLIGRFCGTNLPKRGNIISSHNTLYFWFHSDSTVAKQGFILHWTSIQPVCGGDVDATTHGRISSPGSPGKYPPNRDCYWHINTSLGKRILLHFFEFDIESHVNCSFDFLAIYDGAQTADPLINKYCNSTQPAPVQSAGSDLLIHFHSDAFASGNGFQIAYAPVEGIPGCGGYFTQDKGEITSPSFNGSYLNNMLCEYKIRTSSDTKIRLQFYSFGLERSVRCLYDYLKIYDGPTEMSPLIGKYCGTKIPDPRISSSNQLYLIFKTDHNIPSKGFRIGYEVICQETLTGDSGIVKSPGYPFGYPRNRICEYIISTNPGKAIQMSFQDFDIEDNRYNNCRYDYVEVRDGPNQNSTLLGRYCGGTDHKPPVLISQHNFMYIKFNSDLSITGTGFYANYTTIATKCGGIYKETTGVINHPSDQTSYKKNENCIWILDAPDGMHISLSWNRFDIERLSSCENDYLELIEIDTNNQETSLGKFCGINAPPALSTTSNRLKMKFQSDFSVQASGFSVSYTFLSNRNHCGAVYVQTHGFIYSPGWPDAYENNRNCIWLITVPIGQQIKLNISEFSLERPIHDNCRLGDYLEIRNGASGTSPLIGEFCGSFQSKVINSFGNSLYLHFHSDYYSGGSGFKIEWDGSITGCGGTLTGISGSISSPNYPNNYPENAQCFYRIVTNSGSSIKISFIDLDLERTHNCKDDYIEVFDGRDTNAASFGRFCNMPVAIGSIVTTSNMAFVKFRSDFLLGGKGFMLKYETNCNNNVTGRYGIIESPNFPNNYPRYLDCLWTINVPKGNKINITYTHFNIYKRRMFRIARRSNCTLDYLQMKETSDLTYSDKLCGTKIPQAFTTRSNSFQIKLSTKAFLSRSGFRLEWASYGCGGHLQKTAGRIHMDSTLISKGEIECEWLIETAEGKSVQLIFTDVFLTESKNCSIDAIEIYNGQDGHAPLLTRFCKRNTFYAQSTGNFMLVRLIKRSSLKDLHFEGQYHSVASVCGGNIYAQSGFIFSKNFPKDYENNLDCIWSISVPAFHRIELNFIDLDLNPYLNYYNDDDCGDSIKIYDGGSLLSNYTYRICSKSYNKHTQIISKGSYLQVQFTTNEAGIAKGFKANFSVTCGATIKAMYSGILTNDNLVGHLSKNCTWIIKAPQLNEKIYLTFTRMDIPINRDIITNRTCTSSYLRVYNGDGDDAPLIDEYCGRKVPPMIVSQGNAITIELGTYGDTITGQFSANYSPLEETCGGTFTSEQGAIASPNYPRPYRPNIDCEWILNTSPGNKVYVTFEALDINYSDGCNEDYLEIRENNGGGKMLRLYCGNEIPTNTTVSSILYIKFHSADKTNGRGFLLHYGFLHGNEIYGQENGEIASPLYPFMFKASGDYWWIIFNNKTQPITISIDKLEIPSHGDICYSKLSIYDGFNREATSLGEFCGLLTEPKVIVSTSSTVYIGLKTDESNTGAIFHLQWTASDLNIAETEPGKINCGQNYTELVPSGQSKFFQSPKYPENYNSDLSCEWIFKSELGRHLSINFLDFQLEETHGCFADSISVYSAYKPNEWKPIKEHICLAELAKSLNNLTGSLVTYMKIIFKTDSTVTGRGFRAQVISKCGGIITDLSNSFGPTWFDAHVGSTRVNMLTCDWTVKVRPGRQIKLKFQQFNLTNSDNDCKTYVVIRNGDSIEAPLLGNGKYCGYSHENRTEIETSGNSLFVTFTYNKRRQYDSDPFENFLFHYEEKDVNCGGTIALSMDFSSEIINSPNYPSVGVPYSVCEWVIIGPPGEIIRADFIERFDLDDVDDCATEVVEIRDGPSRLSTLKGRFCGEKPGTVKTTNNMMYVKYVTELAEPRNGFKANISIDTCGGTIVASNGELKSPGYPHFSESLRGSVCVWRLIAEEGKVFNLNPSDIHLPQSESECTTKITIEETVPGSNNEVVLKTYCAQDTYDHTSVQSSSNNVSIKLHIGTPSQYSHLTEYRGFRFSFNSTQLMCAEMLSTSEGYISTPSYPSEIVSRYCYWILRVPDETRRIRLEILDIDTDKDELFISSDFSSQSLKTGQGKRVLESTGNYMVVYITPKNYGIRHRFKARFSSNEPALCGGLLRGLTGQIVTPNINETYSCEWRYNTKPKAEVVPVTSNNYTYSTIILNSIMNSSKTSTRCGFSVPRLTFITQAPQQSIAICGITEVSLIIPSTSLRIKAYQTQNDSLNFHVNWIAQPCGGVVQPGEDYVNVINIPSSYNDTLDCVWTIKAPIGSSSLEMHLDGTFELDCQNEFLRVTNRLSAGSPLILFEYCKGKMQEQPAVTHFRYLYVQYHSDSKNHTMNNIKLLVRTTSDVCGKRLQRYDTEFKSPNFPKSYKPNQECTWEINADVGYRVSLRFIERFVIEMSPNCTSDAVIIYDWIDDEYIEMDRLCGRELPGSYNSTYDRMKVVFRTDNKTNLDGFKAHWSQICGGTYYATEKDQILYSPGYPDRYKSNMNCVYNIRLLNRQSPSLMIKFEDFALEGSYPECLYDNLTIVTHDSSDVYCGNEVPKFSDGFYEISLVFKSDEYKETKGFKLTYGVYNCGGNITNDTDLTSNIFEKYANNLDCQWKIEAPKDKIVILKFSYIHLEASYECYNDFIAVYEGFSTNYDQRLALMCGNVNSTTVIRSHGNKMLLNFVTDSSIAHEGFKANVFFSYSTSVGCGGTINVTSGSSTILKSPLIGNNMVYENFLDCFWTIKSPADTQIRITFTSFHISPCSFVSNQTAIGFSNCDCDLVEIKDGINPGSISIGTYCGHTYPPSLISSGNVMGVRLYTDGELTSSGFEAELTAEPSVCGQSVYSVTSKVLQFKSPGYDTGSITKGLNCIYHFVTDAYAYNTHRITIKNLDLQSASVDEQGLKHCDKDKLTITSRITSQNVTQGKDFVVNYNSDIIYSYINYDSPEFATKLEFCGLKETTDYYVTGSITMALKTSSESSAHRGFEIEVVTTGFCGRNYTETYGRLQSNYEISADRDCYTLITVPENRTISLYFVELSSAWQNNASFYIYDGKDTRAARLKSLSINDENSNPVFSTGRYVLIHNHADDDSHYQYDIVYMSSDKGRGCGGTLHSTEGKVTSPLYPYQYRRVSTCEWVLETPVGTRLFLHFSVFDLGSLCDQNYLQLVDSTGNIISTFCSEPPADYTSKDNYVKIVFITNQNNGGTGWEAHFLSAAPGR